MFRNGTAPTVKTKLNVTLTHGGLGDKIGELVAVEYLIRKFPWIKVNLWVPDYFEALAKNLLQGLPVKIDNHTNAAKGAYDDKLNGVSTLWSKHTPMRTHPVDYGFHVLIDYHSYTVNEKNYLKLNPCDISKYNLPEKYVVISVSSVEEVKRFPADTINGISNYCLSMGYMPVFVGQNKKGHISDGVDFSKGINLADKTDLIELGSVISKASAFVSMDGGSIHLAGCTDVPIVAGYTFVNPNHIMPIRNGEIGYNVYPVGQPESLGCRYCQTNMAWLLNHDFRKCYYDDFACVKNMTSLRFIKELEKILDVSK